jgi:zona occludens toxin
MITLETGLPGAGKTLLCVDKLLRPLVGATVRHEDSEGNAVEVQRVIYSNINGLLLEHEKIGPGAPWIYDGKTDSWSQPEGGDKFGLNNWHEWAKPGSVIVYDEIQKPWPLAASGSKVPPCITALETHRHMGVDFIPITQHPMLIHANLVRLVGRHLHIRRMGNMGLAIVYEWDSCSRTLLYKNAFAKSPYRYAKDVFKLYKSAELHTKQPRKMPSLIWGVGIGLAAMVYFGPAAYGRIRDRISPPPVVAKVAEPKVTTTVTFHPPGEKADT